MDKPLNEPHGEPDPSCFSSLYEFRHRAREWLAGMWAILWL